MAAPRGRARGPASGGTARASSHIIERGGRSAPRRAPAVRPRSRGRRTATRRSSCSSSPRGPRSSHASARSRALISGSALVGMLGERQARRSDSRSMRGRPRRRDRSDERAPSASAAAIRARRGWRHGYGPRSARSARLSGRSAARPRRLIARRSRRGILRLVLRFPGRSRRRRPTQAARAASPARAVGRPDPGNPREWPLRKAASSVIGFRLRRSAASADRERRAPVRERSAAWRRCSQRAALGQRLDLPGDGVHVRRHVAPVVNRGQQVRGRRCGSRGDEMTLGEQRAGLRHFARTVGRNQHPREPRVNRQPMNLLADGR